MEFKTNKTIKITISKEEFKEYLECQYSGLTNMFNLSNVEMITGLSKEKIKVIISHYDELKEKFKNIEIK
jgi:hypothetical protein